MFTGISIDPIRVSDTLMGQAPRLIIGIEIDNYKISTYDTNVNIREQKDGISYGK